MRLHLAKLTPVVLVGGCSILYNPDHIDKPRGDAKPIDLGETPVDIEIRADANPIAMQLDEAFPTTVYEGTGIANSGSRPEVVVLRGKQFVAANNLMVTVTPTTSVALEGFEVSGNGDYIAVLLSAPIQMGCSAPTTQPLHIEVKQDDGAGGTVMKSLDTVSLACLPELTSAVAASGSLAPLYSKIDIAGPYDFGTGDGAKAILKSTSYISITGAIDASAAGNARGPGGGTAGTPGNAGGGPGAGGGGGGLVAAGGGGGGYDITGMMGGTGNGGAAGAKAGDIWISSYATNQSSGGGGGGPTTGVAGGAGGAGGGTLELSAPGNVTLGAITANGGAGADGGLAGDGGAGTGGTVLVRAGGTLMASTIAVSKGNQPSNSNGGTSSDGRVRVDAAAGMHPSNATKGPMWINPPTKVTLQQPTLMLRGTQNDSTATLRVYDKGEGVVPGGPYSIEFSNTNPGVASVMPTLKAGFNKVCVWVAGGAPSIDESVNCVHIAYLPP